MLTLQNYSICREETNKILKIFNKILILTIISLHACSLIATLSRS